MYYDLTETERVELETSLGRGLCPSIPHEEWAGRINRTTQLMQERKLDALLVYAGGQVLTGREWARYFVNYKEPLWNAESFIIIRADGHVCFVMNYPGMIPLLPEASPVKDFRPFRLAFGPNRYAELIPCLQKTLKDLGLSNARIGQGRHGMQGDMLPDLLDHNLTTGLPGVKFEDASNLLWDLIAVKTEYDIEMIRRSNAVVADGVNAIYGALGEGRKEHEYYAAFWEAVCDRGAEVDEAAGCHVDSQSAPGSELGNKPFSVTLRRMHKGDVLMIDPGVTYRGYVSDLARTAVIGPPNSDLKKMFDTVMTGHQRMVEELRPGVTAARLSETWFKTIEKAGYRRENSHVIQGHGIGFMKNEVPMIANGADPFTIKEGMTISIETGLFELNVTRARVEDAYVVRANGAERLTPGPQDLYVA